MWVLSLAFDLLCMTWCPFYFVIILMGKKDMFYDFNVLFLFLAVPLIGLWCVLVVFSTHTFFLISDFDSC